MQHFKTSVCIVSKLRHNITATIIRTNDYENMKSTAVLY